ncbi:hypothetical protein COT29_00420 [Candidatus Micrarchaeota archaeon CG08_land_8_20_14_0_20_59_11]|nr:MAG: hypothetical protein COT29_00420 [Candidatus Micrarchaeota archaeon CG08_land_8_20_14_0_20_59_11]
MNLKGLWTRSNIALAALLLFLAAYIATGFVLFAFGVFACVVAVVLLEIVTEDTFKSAKGAKQSAWELGIAFASALAAWFILGFILQTSSPINVVTSCSMLPVLERGDLILLQGGSVAVPEAQYAGALANATYEQRGIRIDASDGTRTYRFVLPIVGGNPLFEYGLEKCAARARDGTETHEFCTYKITLNGTEYALDKSNDVIVYEPTPAYYGLIIHRAFLKIKAKDGAYYLTRGDNNEFLDQQSGIRLVPEKDVKGKVLLRVPYVGYLKLFLFMQFEEPKGCGYLVGGGG